jgi:ribonuclease VapC
MPTRLIAETKIVEKEHVILDASAVLALLYGEPGSEQVAAHGQDALLLSVNLSEILSRAIDKGGNAAMVKTAVDRLQLQIIPFDEDLAFDAGQLREETRSIGASLGDRACLALVRATGLPVLTADKRWSELDIGLDIRQIR